MKDGNAFGKTICSICYEDLKPIVEDLQAISICGHVFHELCLQQWFEYCSKARKTTCPVCKQSCSQGNVSRLYFQSIGDSTELNLSQKQSEVREADPEALRREVKKLEGKLSGISSAFEIQRKDLKQLNDELYLCKEHSKKEAALKNEALKQKESFQQLLHSKSEELVKSSSECYRLQEKNMALAKELAALKLVSDVNLEEEEVLKLASFGHCANSKDTVDILKKSLVLRNKSYKELIAQCNLLGRGETRSLKKLEKAEEKKKKLKKRVQELEMTLEEKDNEVLRALKTSKKAVNEEADVNGINWNFNPSRINIFSSEDPKKQPVEPIMESNQIGSMATDPSHCSKTGHSRFHKDLGVTTCKEDTTIINRNQERDSYFIIDDDDDVELSPTMHKHSSSVFKSRIGTCISEEIAVQKFTVARPVSASDTIPEAQRQRQSGVELLDSSTVIKKSMDNTFAAAMEEDVLILDDIRIEAPSLGEQCFSSGILGPDGTSRYLGKWCKRVQSNASISSSVTMQGSIRSSGDLIAVGADGRGGKVKVLRSENLSSLDGKGNSLWPKRCKVNASGQQSQGCLQIEHFFGKASKK